MTILSLADLREMDMVDTAGNRLGSVKDGLFDAATGRLRYALLAPSGSGLAGALGVSERLVPIPYSILRLESGQLVLPRDPAALAGAPGYISMHPPGFDHQYEEQIATYWGVAPAALLDDATAEALTAGEFAGAELPTVAASADLRSVARLLAARQAEAAQVVDAQGHALGIITLRDLGIALGRTGGVDAAQPTQPGALSRVTAPPAWSGSDEPAASPPVEADEPSPQRPEGAAPVAAPETPPDAASEAPAEPAGAAPGATPIAVTTQATGGPETAATPDTSPPAPNLCPQCGAVNRQGALFCARCGTRLR